MKPQEPDGVLRIRKYPNRRFYDQTRSRHVTLDDLYHDVRAGREIVVTDADGRDITNLVLAQIILEHDPPKLGLFPTSLFHQAIQANETMFRRFIDDYFSRALEAFVASREQFEEWLRRTGMGTFRAASPFEWAQSFMRGFERPRGEPSSRDAAAPVEPSPSEPGATSPGSHPPADDLAVLRRQVEQLGAELSRLKSQPATSKPPRSTAPRKKKPRNGGKN